MSHQGLTYIQRIPELAPLLEHADHVDVKTVTGDVDLRTFLAHFLDFSPQWITQLFRIRAVFVRLLGMRQAAIPPSIHLTPDKVPMNVGDTARFFTLRKVKEDRYWIADADDEHLKAVLGVVVEPLAVQPGQPPLRKFHVLTVVYYHNWAGPFYFSVIRPFHHLVVGSMARAGIRPA